jgi:hypothetical protein
MTGRQRCRQDGIAASDIEKDEAVGLNRDGAHS